MQKPGDRRGSHTVRFQACGALCCGSGKTAGHGEGAPRPNAYGKDAEAAMALSLGKPVIFYCNQERRSRFYRDAHPLSWLIEFETGVALGAMVTNSLSEVSDLLSRMFENNMEYRLEHSKPGHLRLLERTTIAEQ
jgi:hypothetical protein